MEKNEVEIALFESLFCHGRFFSLQISNRRLHLTKCPQVGAMIGYCSTFHWTEKEKSPIEKKKKTSIEATKRSEGRRQKWKCPVEDCRSERYFLLQKSHRREHFKLMFHSWSDEEQYCKHIPISSREIRNQEKERKRATEADERKLTGVSNSG